MPWGQRMSFAPLLNAPSIIQLHAFAAMGALALGLVQFSLPKGTLPHRTMGWIWVAWWRRRGQFVLDTWPSDQAGRAVEPDSSAVDLQPDHASARNLVRSQAPCKRPPDHDDLDFHGRTGHRRTVHIRAGTHHACRCIRSITAVERPIFQPSESGSRAGFWPVVRYCNSSCFSAVFESECGWRCGANSPI